MLIPLATAAAILAWLLVGYCLFFFLACLHWNQDELRHCEPLTYTALDYRAPEGGLLDRAERP